MRIIYKASAFFVLLLVASIILPGIKSAHAACSYSYQIKSLTSSGYMQDQWVDSNMIPFGPSLSGGLGTLPVQNPPSILQNIHFTYPTNTKDCFPADNTISPPVTWGSNGSVGSITTLNGSFNFNDNTGGDHPSKIGRSGDSRDYSGLESIDNSVNGSRLSTSIQNQREDALIETVAKNGGYTVNFTATSTSQPKIVHTSSTFVKASNCVYLGGKGSIKVVFMRGPSLSLALPTIKDYLDYVDKVIGVFINTDPYKSYVSKFSFYVDLHPLVYTTQQIKVPFDAPPLTSTTVSGFSCEGNVAGTTFLPYGDDKESIFMLIDSGSKTSHLNGSTFDNRNTSNTYLPNLSIREIVNGHYESKEDYYLVPVHESGHSIGWVTDEYNCSHVYHGVYDGQNAGKYDENCVVNPIDEFRSSKNNLLYGSTTIKGTMSSNQKAQDPGLEMYIPSSKSLMNILPMASSTILSDGTFKRIVDARFNVVSCGYLVSAILREPIDKAHAETHWPECMSMDTTKEGIPAVTAKPVASNLSKVNNSSVPNTFRMMGSNFTPTNNSIQFTVTALAEAQDPSTLVATPHSFMEKISSFFGAVWSFFKNLIPYTHGQVTNSIGKTYVIGNISSDSAAGTSITFVIPSSMPNGVYSVAVGSFNSEWAATSFKVTINSSGVTVSGNPTIGSGAYSEGATVAATVAYTCPAPKPGGFVYNLVGNKCVPIGTMGTGGTGTRTVVICAAGKVSVGNVCITATSLAIAATLTYTCPTVPAGINGYYTLVPGSKCVFHFYAPTIKILPVSTTTTPVNSIPATLIRYTCPSANYSLSGTTCTQISVACTPTPVMGGGSTCTPQVLPATPIYACTVAGFTLSGSMCIENPTSEGTVTTPATTQTTQVSVAATTSYTCPSGSTLNGTNCESTDTVGIVANSTYTKSVTGLFSYVYSCSSGYVLKGQKCYSTAVKVTPATATYLCATGYTLNATTKMCVK